MGKSDSELVDLSGETLRKEPSYVVIGDRIEVLEGREAAPEIDEGCPCTLIEPCSVNCTCANPIMSGGCLRCCRYGSLEQRTAQAQRLTGEITEAMVEQAAEVIHEMLRVAFSHNLKWGELSAESRGTLRETARAALTAALEAREEEK